MTSITRTLAAAAFLVSAAPALGGPERDYNEPPPGSAPEDAKLWRDLRQGTSMALWEVGRIAQCSSRISYGKYYESIDAAIEKGPPATTSRAKELRDGLTAAAEAAQRSVPSDGGRVHACRVTLLDFEQRMDPRNKEIARELPEARKEAKQCADRMNQLLGAVTPAADRLEHALDEIDVYLNRPAVKPANAPKPPEAAKPAAPRT